ncbi:TPA: DUF1642 domain-containing protein [Enterococcus faecalis]|nr:DUF1642 domain-containing protein [Enterococcus faecalis]
MNKQELIRELKEEKRKIEWKEDKYELHNAASCGKERAYSLAIDLAKELDEPKKVVVPKFVAEWLETCKENASLADCLQCQYFSASDDGDVYATEKVENWVFENDNAELLANAWVNGYEVETEQLYKVVIDHKYLVQLFSGRTDARLVEYEELTNWHDSAYKLTESVIKSIDERYWPFAVKVGNE